MRLQNNWPEKGCFWGTNDVQMTKIVQFFSGFGHLFSVLRYFDRCICTCCTPLDPPLVPPPLHSAAWSPHLSTQQHGSPTSPLSSLVPPPLHSAAWFPHLSTQQHGSPTSPLSSMVPPPLHGQSNQIIKRNEKKIQILTI